MPSKAPKPRAAKSGPLPADVEAIPALAEHPLRREILALREIIRGVDPRVTESVKWNAPSFSTSEHFATFNLRSRDGVQVVLHLGAKPRPDAALRTAISDPAGLLEWRGPDRALATFRDLADIEARRDAFAALLRQWITFVR